jgi:hypothetical protein
MKPMVRLHLLPSKLSSLSNNISIGKGFNSKEVRETVIWLTDFYKSDEFEKLVNVINKRRPKQ